MSMERFPCTRVKVSPPCMLKKKRATVQMETRVGRLAERSEARLPTQAGDRSFAPRPLEAVLKRDRRRLCGTSPNSRRSRSRRKPKTSSHSQGRVASMEGSITSFVGVDVGKRSVDIHVLPEGKSCTLKQDASGRQALLAVLPAAGTCLIVVEATGGYERLLIAELTGAGHLVARINPRQARDFAKARASWPRPTVLTPRFWPGLHATYDLVAWRKPRKNREN